MRLNKEEHTAISVLEAQVAAADRLAEVVQEIADGNDAYLEACQCRGCTATRALAAYRAAKG